MNKKFLFIPALAIMFNMYATSQNSVKQELYQAFLHNDTKKWEQTTKNFEKKANLNNTSDLLNLIHCYYGSVSVLIDKKENQKAAENIKHAEALIDKVLKTNPNNAEALNYKGVFLSYHIAMNKIKATTLGKQSLALINKAYALAPNNTQILFDKGNALYYTPKMFGGDKKEALTFYQKAIKIIETRKETNQNWVYIQLLFQNARSNELINNMQAAEAGYKKALKAEPNFKLVRDKYYPEFLKKTS